ncbi:MAG: hypothetical protein HOL48_09225 [Porticoccaceae bacterium]|nr:hypothetical protein [Porticoccaceae bacterium]
MLNLLGFARSKAILCIASALVSISLIGCTNYPTSAGIELADEAGASRINTPARILSAYHGLDSLPALGTGLCGIRITGEDGMPVVFSVQIDNDSISPEVFAVETSAEDIVTPVCATLRPAVEPLEQRTILLVGPFSSSDSHPTGVEVVGELKGRNGNSLLGLRIGEVTALAAGPSLVFAERFSPNTRGIAGECPEESVQAIQLTWEGGVTGPQGEDLAEEQRTAISVLLENGDLVHPISLGEDDPDNHIIACLAESSRAVSVSVLPGYFHDPGDDANPATSIVVGY